VRSLGQAGLRAGFVLIAASAAIIATPVSVFAQQYFNGSQTTPNGAINGGGGVWNNTTTNWTDDPGTVSSAYDPSALTTTIFGASTTSTPASGGTVTVAPGGVTLTGAVVFGLTGDNSIYTIAGGNLTVAAGGTSFSVADVTGTGGGPAPAAIINSNIVGADGINVQGAGILGSGILVLNGTNTYAGGTTICACATLQLGDATHTGSIVGTVDNSGGFNIVNANTAGITTLTNDFGITTFFGANTAATMTIDNINGGETDFGVALGTDTASAGSATIVNRTGGTTIFNAASTAANANITNRYSGETDFYDNSRAGNATITNRYFGVTTFNDSSSAENAAITNRYGGSTFFFNDSTAGNATITNGSFGVAFGFAPVGLGFFDNSTAGNATIINNNNGLIAFGVPFGSDTASAGQANITNNAGSSLEFNAFTTAGNATITTLSGGAVAFFDNSTGGNARFITNGTGYVDFGGSIGPNSDFRVTAGSIEGSGTYYIGGGNTLVVGGNNRSTEVSGVIDDGCGCFPGSLEKVGTGTLTLSGVNTYTGSTLVSAGTLLVTGSIASSAVVFVDNGATLGGTGTVAPVFLSNGATLAPGLPTALGTLTVNDLLAFCDCTFYNVKVTSAGNDLTQVVSTGGPAIAGLAGTVRVSSLNSTYRFNNPYTILTALGGFDSGGGPTQFNSLVLPTGINGSLSYTTTDVNLTLWSALGALSGLNINQRNVANALDGAFNAGGSTGALGAIFNGNIPLNLSQASGEIGTGTQQATFNAMNLFLGDRSLYLGPQRRARRQRRCDAVRR
jgi:autotransporter-associated beta strand protein